jgi:hypothetical protein
MREFGYMLDLIIALRAHGIPLFALNLTFFTEDEKKWIRSGYEVGLGTLIEHSLGKVRADA